MSVKPILPKGTRDLLPAEMLKRGYITSIIKEVFEKYGFKPIETPAMEQLTTLTGKYGEEGDKLIFKILNNGDFLSKANAQAYNEGDSSKFSNSITDKALRYDLTVPFARFVVQNQNEISFPFRRYQIQPVWRADRPQKGRFREFYQCDADVVGSNSLMLELEFIRIYTEVFESLGIPFSLQFNNRKLLAGFAEKFQVTERLGEFTILLDKMDKIGVEGLMKLLTEKKFPSALIEALTDLIKPAQSNKQAISVLDDLLQGSKIGLKGVEEVSYLVKNTEQYGFANKLQFDFSLARGLDYYTGAIFEIKTDAVSIGSLGGGGRYDDLTGVFGLSNLSGVGISFGLDRIQLVMEELNLFSMAEKSSTEVLFINFGEAEALYSMKLANELRDMGVKTEVYPDAVKLRKQMDYANKRRIDKVILIGSEEMAAEIFVLKEMSSGNQQKLRRIELLEHFSSQDQRYGAH